jgi:hypothetical protein
MVTSTGTDSPGANVREPGIVTATIGRDDVAVPPDEVEASDARQAAARRAAAKAATTLIP